MDWSDHGMWWPEKNVWLDKTRWTLDQYNVTADAVLHFTPMHKSMRIQLPDLRYIDCSVNFSLPVFNTVINLCNELGIRHPEELSLSKPLESVHLKFNYGDERRRLQQQQQMSGQNQQPGPAGGHGGRRGRGHMSLLDIPRADRADTNSFISQSHTLRSAGHNSSSRLSWSGQQAFRSLGRNGNFLGSLRRRSDHLKTGDKPNLPITPTSNFASTQSLSPAHIRHGMANADGSTWSLALSPPPSNEARNTAVRPRNVVERARLNVAWLDSSLSLMEQGVRDFDTLLLRFKFYAFFDLDPKNDPVRINLIYEQAKWQILHEAIDCTEEEMMLFAALQLQVALQCNVPQPSEEDETDQDDIDAALKDLEISLEGRDKSNGGATLDPDGLNEDHIDIMSVPSLIDNLRYLRPKRFTFRNYRRLCFVLRELQLTAYRSEADFEDVRESALFTLCLRGCEACPVVNVAQGRFAVRLAVPTTDSMLELSLKFDSERQYVRWMAAFRLASKGKTMSDCPGYSSEVRTLHAFLSMQHPASQPIINPSTLDIKLSDYVASRFLRRSTSKLRFKILEAQANVKDLNLLEAKMNFIRAWQSLPDFGISLFVARFHNEKKDELLGISSNRLMRLNLQTGDPIKTWRFNTIKAWNVNWETKHMMIELGDGRGVVFKCLSADCKVVHEFIGGYIFLSMRTRDQSNHLDHELFHKLTGGWN